MSGLCRRDAPAVSSSAMKACAKLVAAALLPPLAGCCYASVGESPDGGGSSASGTSLSSSAASTGGGSGSSCGVGGACDPGLVCNAAGLCVPPGQQTTGSSSSGGASSSNAGGSSGGSSSGTGATASGGISGASSSGGSGGVSSGSNVTSGGSTGGSSTGSTCPQPFVVCDGVCTDTRYDPANCGGCDAPCIAGQSCDDGTCAGIPDGGDAGFQCSPGVYLCVGEELWDCTLEGNNAEFVVDCPTYLQNDGQTGICQTSQQDSACPTSAGACCCVLGKCETY